MGQHTSKMANRCGSLQYAIAYHGAKCRANCGYDCKCGMPVDTGALRMLCSRLLYALGALKVVP